MTLQEIQEKIVRILHNEEFRKHCKKCKEENPHFEEELAMAEKIARLDIREYKPDSILIDSVRLSEEDIHEGIKSFYKHLDELYPSEKSLGSVAVKNLRYLTHDFEEYKKAINEPNAVNRSICSSWRDEQGNANRIIYARIEHRVSDVTNACHEFAHSLSKMFTECRNWKDKDMAEIIPVIVDTLANHYFQTEFPELAENFNEDLISTQVSNVVKARYVLLEGLVIKLMLGEITLNEIQQRYGYMFLRNTRMLENCLESIEKYRFANMFEKRYLLPQAIAQLFMEKYKTNPQEAIKTLKTILENDADCNLEDALKSLGLESQEQVIDDYTTKFKSRMDGLIENRHQIQDKADEQIL